MDKFASAKAESESKFKELQQSYDKVSKTLEAEWTKIQKGYQELQSKKEDLAKQNGGSSENISDDDVLDINAGGEIIRVTRGSLTQKEGSRLEALFSGRWEKQLHRDSKGRIFLDVNPTCFRCIVDHLNVCAISPPDNPPDLPRTDPENQVYLDALLAAFGLYDYSAVDSKILTYNNPKQFHALIGFLEEDDLGSGLELLYRGSRDGMDAATFHQKCDDQGPTVTLVKSDQDYIFGGFADKSWQSSSDGTHVSSEKAFLFGLECSGGQDPVKIRLMSMGSPFAFYFHRDYGPAFGGVVEDLATIRSEGAYSYLGYYYAPPGGNASYFTGATEFTLSEIEVFKVTKGGTRPRVHLPSSSAHAESWCQLTFDSFPDDIQKSFQAQQDAIAEACIELQLLQDNFEKEQAIVDAFCPDGRNDIVSLNVSGRIMAVKHSTLAMYPDSVLYKQFVDENWNGSENRKRKRVTSPRDWSKEEVIAWSQNIAGLSEDVSSKFNDVTGAELLVLGRDDIKDLGITRPGTVALIVDAIQRLRAKTNAESSSVIIHHSDYCFANILDHMRLKAMKNLGFPDPEPPQIREADKKNFEAIVGYFFPNEEAAKEFLG